MRDLDDIKHQALVRHEAFFFQVIRCNEVQLENVEVGDPVTGLRSLIVHEEQ